MPLGLRKKAFHPVLSKESVDMLWIGHNRRIRTTGMSQMPTFLSLFFLSPLLPV
jgi:hypothetical protein